MRFVRVLFAVLMVGAAVVVPASPAAAATWRSIDDFETDPIARWGSTLTGPCNPCQVYHTNGGHSGSGWIEVLSPTPGWHGFERTMRLPAVNGGLLRVSCRFEVYDKVGFLNSLTLKVLDLSGRELASAAAPAASDSAWHYHSASWTPRVRDVWLRLIVATNGTQIPGYAAIDDAGVVCDVRV